MINHHIQKDIIRAAARREVSRYSELKPDELEGNVFLYHLKQLVSSGYIVKEDELYRLSEAGKREVTTINDTKLQRSTEPRSIFLVAIRHADGRWMLRRRAIQPNVGKLGFIHGEPVVGQPLQETVSARCQNYTGLSGQLTHRGSGYITIASNDGEIESYNHVDLFSMGVSEDTLTQSSDTGKNLWIDNPDFSSHDMIASMADLVELLEQRVEPFFFDLRYSINN